MKSSSGQYFIGLDHVRAVAAFTVFTWHFIHVNGGQLSPPPIFPLSLLTEGHTGVALFMVLSGYLFAKLLDGKTIVYSSFIWNRILRLVPLLLVVILIVGLEKYLAGSDFRGYVKSIFAGVLKPSLPNGGWSITAEFHFYLVLPVFLFITRKWKYSLFFVILAAVAIRFVIHQERGEIQSLAYWTIIGRVDQFVLGILAYNFRERISGRTVLVLCASVMFAVIYWYFDSQGGFYNNSLYPSPSSIWIYLPTIEGVFYGLLIAWYDNSFKHSAGIVSRFIAVIGTYSYSIYLFHFFIVFRISNAVSSQLVDLTNIYLAMLFSIPCFLLMVPIGYLSYRFIELPFLRFRASYIVSDRPVSSPFGGCQEKY